MNGAQNDLFPFKTEIIVIFFQGTMKQTYSNPPLVDTELLRLSLRLFKKRTGLSQEKPDDCKLPAVNKQPEVCVT